MRVAGRIRAMRNSGMFIDLHDASGKIQIFCHRDLCAPKALATVRLLDIGDLIGVEGLVRRTPRGELTVNATAVPFSPRRCGRCPRNTTASPISSCAIASAISI